VADSRFETKVAKPTERGDSYCGCSVTKTLEKGENEITAEAIRGAARTGKHV
jgi:hypothetical protein